MDAKESNRLKDFCIDLSEPSKINVVSSAYWLILHSESKTQIPLIWSQFLIALPSISTHKIKR